MDEKVADGWTINIGTRPVAKNPSAKEIEAWISRVVEPSSLHLDNIKSYVNVIGSSGHSVVVHCWPNKKYGPTFQLFNLNLWDDDSENEEEETIEIIVSDQAIDYYLYELVSRELAAQAVIEFIFDSKFSPELGWRLYDSVTNRYVLTPDTP